MAAKTPTWKIVLTVMVVLLTIAAPPLLPLSVVVITVSWAA